MIAAYLYRIVSKLPDIRGKGRAISLILRFCEYAQSAYGPYLRVRAKDLTNRLSLSGFYGYELHDMIRALPKDAVFLDIGSNTGVYALVAGQHLTHGRAYAFEPNNRVFADLVNNIDRNGLTNVTAFNFGLSSRSGLVEFSYRPSHSGTASIIEASETNVRTATALLMRPSEIGLADRLKGRKVLCKIDVEGAEAQVLASLAEADALAEVDTFFVEIDPENMAQFGDEPDAIYDLMTSHGFSAQTDRRGERHYDEIFARSSRTGGSCPTPAPFDLAPGR